MSRERQRILLVEDNSGDAFLVRALLEEAAISGHTPFDVDHVSRLGAALARLAESSVSYDLVMLDLGLPDSDGLGSVETIRSRFPGVAIVVMTGLDDTVTATSAVERGAQDYLVKGRSGPEDMVRVLDYAIVRQRLEEAARQSEAEHRALFELNPAPVWVHDLESGVFLEVNAAAQRLYGWSREQFLRMNVVDVFADRDLHRVDHIFTTPANGTRDDTCRQKTHDGGDIRVEISAHRLTFRGRQACLVIAFDVTDRQRMIDAKEASEQRYRELFEMSLGLICEHDLEGTIRSINPAAAQALGYEPEQIRGINLRDLVPEPFRHQVPLYLDTIIGNGRFEGLLTVETRNGEWRAWRFHNRLRSEPGRASYVIGHAQDVTEELRHRDELQNESLTDPLTSARNRRYLEHLSRSGSLTDWACVMVDLDHFKQINDTYGHQRGDEVLVGVARFLASHARKDDVVLRMGGDEFMVLLGNAGAAEAAALAERIAESASTGAPCGLSLGWAVRQDGESLERTIARADDGLYEQRRIRRGTAEVSR